MSILYVSTGENKLSAVSVDENGNLVRILQTVDPVVDPLPPNLPEKIGRFMKMQTPTEWISRHPKYPILYALTSFWNEHEAIITAFKIGDDGMLTKIASQNTGGHQAAQGTFSPDWSTYAIAHHNGGKLSLFDVSKRDVLDKPILVITPPELEPGTFEAPKAGTLNQGCPGLHGLSYSPNGKFMLVADVVQNAVFSYAVNDKGIPTQPNTPTSQVVCTTSITPSSWLQKLIGWMFALKSPRPRRAAVHPSGKYMYMMHEWTSHIQIYSIDEEGKIDPTLLNEVCCYDPALKGAWVGIGMTAVAELEACDDNLILSVRGMSTFGGRAESSVRLFEYVDGGENLKSIGTLEGITAPVRHFYRKGNVIWVGFNSSKMPLVKKYEKRGDKWTLKGEADVGMDVFCISPPV